MPAPLVFILIPLLAALAAYSLYPARWAADVVMAIGITAVLTALALVMPLNAEPFIRDSFVVLGRAFVLEPVDRVALVAIFVWALLMFAGAGLHRQGRFFLPAGLAALSFLVAALCVRPFLFAAIFLEIVAALSVFMLADGRLVTTRGALRYLILSTLGLPFILFTGWLIDASAANPQDPRWLVWAALALLAGLMILLGVTPFHSWLPSIAENSPPLATAFVVGVTRAPWVFLLLRLLTTYEWFGGNPGVYATLTFGGLAMVAIGGAFAFGQRNLSRSIGYAALIDFGTVLLAIGLGTRVGVEAALAAVAMRGLSIWLWAIGMDTLRRATTTGEMDFESLRGLGWRYPFAVTAVAIGALSLMGLPLMAGFPARWALLQLLAESNPTYALILLMAMTSVGLVVMRGLAAMTTPLAPDEVILPQESGLNRVVLSAGILLVLLLGAFPQVVLPAMVSAAETFGR